MRADAICHVGGFAAYGVQAALMGLKIIWQLLLSGIERALKFNVVSAVTYTVLFVKSVIKHAFQTAYQFCCVASLGPSGSYARGSLG